MEIGELYGTYFGRIYAYAACRLRTAAEAEDVCAAVFQKALAGLAQYDPARGEPAQWLFGIARNEVNYALRRAGLLSFLPLDSFGDIFRGREPRPDETLERVGLNAALAAALSELDQKERDLIALKFYSGLNNREIAAMTGLSESNVGTLLYRCMGKLRARLAGEEI